ncbi:MAG: hypothetical protein Q9168_003221 [Polycauliona sp. 1 TL-2023]
MPDEEIDTLGTDETPETDDLLRLFHEKLPQEMKDEVEYWLYEIAFCPGRLYPHHRKGWYEKCCSPRTEENLARPELLCLSKSIKAKYEKRMWMENVWVINIGHPKIPEHGHFILQLPYKASKWIQKVHLRFGHLHGEPEIQWMQAHRPWTDHETNWGSQFRILRCLSLNSLTLDFREAHFNAQKGHPPRGKTERRNKKMAQRLQVTSLMSSWPEEAIVLDMGFTGRSLGWPKVDKIVRSKLEKLRPACANDTTVADEGSLCAGCLERKCWLWDVRKHM